MKWIMVANSNDCKIYKYDKNIKKLQLVEEISHPENRLKEQDLVADTFGHYQNRNMTRGSYEPEFTHVEIAADNFAKEMADKLNCGRIKHLYDGLILLMPSTMGGMLFKHLNKNVLGMVQQSIKKNLMRFSEHELKKYLSKNLSSSKAIH